MAVRNITLTLPDDLVRRAKVVAAMRDTSVSALVAEYFEALTRQEDDYDQVWREERRLMADGLSMRVGEISWSRASAHER
jgi:post-segregation antitoxin (ccd killing protein)